MSASFYRLTCLTNLHMGSSEANYDIIDLEVERDPVLEEPTMNSSGVKGALRDYCEEIKGKDDGDILFIFGGKPTEDDSQKTPQQGNYNFFSGDLLARPVRVTEGSSSFALATTPELLRHVQRKLKAFGLSELFNASIPSVSQKKCQTAQKNIQSVERWKVDPWREDECTDFVKQVNHLLGTDNWILMNALDLKNIDLPVLAHNVLENGISRNLWYEQVVPHESIFGLIIRGPVGDERFASMITQSATVQFGAGASTGNGFMDMRRVEVPLKNG